MRKLLSILMAVLTLLSCTMVISATSTTDQSGEVPLTAVIEAPPASYYLSIPQAVTVTGAGDTEVGGVQILNDVSISQEKYVEVTLTHDGKLTSGENEIPYTVHHHDDVTGGDAWEIDYDPIVSGQTYKWYPVESMVDNPLYRHLIYTWPSDGRDYVITAFSLNIEEEDWNSAAPGTYTSKLTFSARLVDTAAAE